MNRRINTHSRYLKSNKRLKKGKAFRNRNEEDIQSIKEKVTYSRQAKRQHTGNRGP